jgi:hypothetical protein
MSLTGWLSCSNIVLYYSDLALKPLKVGFGDTPSGIYC